MGNIKLYLTSEMFQFDFTHLQHSFVTRFRHVLFSWFIREERIELDKLYYKEYK